jgi:uncharacterized SAM-dependent methyltransferase
MSATNVTIHSSQFPENVRHDLFVSLLFRRVNHKFHYDSVKQTQKWLALHQIYSPSRNDADCRAIYKKGFKAVAERIEAKHVHVLGLGCGGGKKDTRLLKLLKARGREVFYTPCDVSLAMVLAARQSALMVLPEQNCFPFVCDLATPDDLSADLNSQFTHRASRVTTFFGMIPNFGPLAIMRQLTALLQPGELLLFSANLAPGPDYAAGVKKILPQYDNAPTRDWLMTFLLDLGVQRRDGKLVFTVEAGELDLKRVVVWFQFRRPRRIEIEDETLSFKAGDSIRLFFSYRYTPERVRKILAGHGLEVCKQWIAKSGEEGVFLCQKLEGGAAAPPDE